MDRLDTMSSHHKTCQHKDWDRVDKCSCQCCCVTIVNGNVINGSVILNVTLLKYKDDVISSDQGSNHIYPLLSNPITHSYLSSIFPSHLKYVYAFYSSPSTHLSIYIVYKTILFSILLSIYIYNLLLILILFLFLKLSIHQLSVQSSTCYLPNLLNHNQILF